MKPYRTAPRATAVAGVSRRRFLTLPLMSAGLALPGVMRIAEAASLWDSLAPTPRSGRISIAYWLGSDRLENLDALSHTAGGSFQDLTGQPVDVAACTAETCAPLVDPRSLAAEGSIPAAQGATVRIHGRHASAGDRQGGSDPALALYVHSTCANEPAFFAWGSGRDPAGESPPMQFTLPAGERGGLRLSCEFGDSAGAERCGLSPCDAGYFASSRMVPLRFGIGFGEPKLRRGVYLLAWRGEDASPLPEWSEFRMAMTQAMAPPPAPDEPERSADAGTAPGDASPTEEPRAIYSRLVPPAGAGAAGFSYLLISVDHPVAPA